MAACPNCGRRAQRTKDWVCEWCGYPLLYGNYKLIDKTYKELQAERNPLYREEREEPEPELNILEEEEEEVVPEPEPPSTPSWKLKKAPRPSYPSRQSEPETEADPPRSRFIPPVRPRNEAPAPQQPAPLPPRPHLDPRPLSEQLKAERPMPPLQPPPIRVEPPPPPEPKEEALSVPPLNAIQNGIQLSVDQVDALFRADSIAANEAFKEKTIVIKGFVNKVFIRDHLDIRYMVLNGARRIVWSARCQFDKEASGPIGRLQEGQAVALKGKYDGYGKHIIFKDCVLVAGGS